jgi:hypothetical protein
MLLQERIEEFQVIAIGANSLITALHARAEVPQKRFEIHDASG